MAGETILHVGYDHELTELREGILQRSGYRVVSLLGNDQVRDSAKEVMADVIVIGSGGQYQERVEITDWLLENVPGTPILAMCAAAQEQYPKGVFPFYGDTARDWLIAVESVLLQRRNRRP
jgi:DNA-binding response OmpR family regulator